MSVNDFTLFDKEKIIKLKGFTSIQAKDFQRNNRDYSDDVVGLEFIEMCYVSKMENGNYCYHITLTDNITLYKYFTLTGTKRNIAFEKQFPCFPYDRALYIVRLNDEKFKIIEKQNIALLSHLETIMTCLRLRAVTDDNLDFEVPPQ